MITEQCTPLVVDSQHDQILRALNTAVAHRFIEWQEWDSSPDGSTPWTDKLTPWDEFNALTRLIPHRPKLKKLGVTFPLKTEYVDRLEVIPQGDKTWQVLNLSKGTEYTVERKGLRLDCSCDQFGNGFCKHRDAVDATIPESEWCEVRGDTGPFGTVSDHERDKRWETAEFHLRQLDQFYELDAVTCEQYRQQHDAWTAYAEGEGPMPGDDSSTPPPLSLSIGQYLPHEFTLTEGQQEAIAALTQWWSGDEKIFRLTGRAGTGKTTVIQPFLKALLNLPTPPKIAVGAPYNKAVKVQGKFLKRFGLHGVHSYTCAALFGVKRKEVGGEEIFERDLDAHQYYADYNLVVIDEIGTVNEALWEILLDAVHDGGMFGTRFVLMGDAAQLPPVNEAESLAFRHPCPSANLTEVKRYDGAIAVLADHVATHLDAPTFPPITQQIDSDGKGIYVSSKAAWEENIRRAFTSDAYKQDPDTCRILAYTNARVAQLNAIVRRALGYTTPWAIGERIIALSPYLVDAAIGPSLTTSDEATILSIQSGSLGVWECYYLTLDIGITVPVPKDPTAYAAELTRLYKAKEFGRYWGLKQMFAELAYGYALTVHRSQGSTFKYVFVDVPNLQKALKKKNRLSAGGFVREGQQLAYVAFTRPSHRLFTYQ